MQKKILIVDDEEDVLKGLEKRLSGAGYSVVKATNGQDAIIMAKDQHPDLILLDIMMPGMDGGQVSQALKDNSTTKDIPVIFLTCLVSKEEEGKKISAVAAGEHFIAKPYDPYDLLKEIAKQLR